MHKVKKALALLGLATLAATNAFAYVHVAALIQKFQDDSIPPKYPVLPALVASFAVAALLTMVVAPLAASALSPKRRRSWLIVGAASVLIFGFALTSAPISSVDNSWNVLSVRNMVVHGQNPYLTPTGAFRDDPAYNPKWARWYFLPMVYGPLWTVLSAIPVLLVQDVRAQMFGMLVLNVAGYVLAGTMLYRWLKRRSAQKAWYIGVFWMLNVTAALEIANAGHNEGAMLPFLVLLATALIDENLTLAAVGVIGAALIKHWPLALAPALLAIPASHRRRLATVGVSVAAMAIAWMPFWSGKQTLNGLLTVAAHGKEPFVFSPFRYVVWYLSVKMNGFVTVQFLRDTALCTSLAILAVVTYSAYRRKCSGTVAALLLMATYHFIWLSWLQPWYLLAFLPFMATSLEKTRAVLAMGALSVIGILCYLYGTPKITGIAMLIAIWLAVYSMQKKQRLESSATTAPQTAPSEQPSPAGNTR